MVHIGAMLEGGILGLVEGATEFIPVSSSGHLVFTRALFGEGSGGLAFDALLQLSTSLALVVYFWKDILSLVCDFFAWVSGATLETSRKTLLLSIILGTIPAVIAGLLLEKQMDTIFRNVYLVALALIFGSLLMLVAEHIGKMRAAAGERSTLTVAKGVWIGLFQCLPLIPGVSRSGATISGGLITGLSQEEATRFSFLLSIPILLGSGLKKLFEVRHDLGVGSFGLPLLFGCLVAFTVGFASIHALLRYLKNHSLDVFIWYRVVLAVLIFIIF